MAEILSRYWATDRLMVSRSRYQWMLEVLSSLALLAAGGLILAAWNSLPPSVPVLFGLDGRPAAWTSRDVLILLGAAAAVIYFLLTTLENVANPPAGADTPPDRQRALLGELLLEVRTISMVVFLGFISGMVRTATREAAGLGSWFLPASAGLLMAVVAVFVVRLVTHRLEA